MYQRVSSLMLFLTFHHFLAARKRARSMSVTAAFQRHLRVSAISAGRAIRPRLSGRAWLWRALQAIQRGARARDAVVNFSCRCRRFFFDCFIFISTYTCIHTRHTYGAAYAFFLAWCAVAKRDFLQACAPAMPCRRLMYSKIDICSKAPALYCTQYNTGIEIPEKDRKGCRNV